MRDKADDSLAQLAPPAANVPIPVGPADTAKFIMRKKPHTLPPLEKFRSLEGRGSPVPQARRRSSVEEQLLQDDGQVLPADGRPLIRLTKCTDDAAPSARLPPSKAGGGGQGPAGGAAPIGGATPAPQLSPMANRYTPLQPIRRSSESGAPNSNHP